MHPGEKQGKPLLGLDEPSLWYEAAAALPPLKADGAILTPEQLEERRAAAEEALANEAAAFENAIGEHLRYHLFQQPARNALRSQWQPPAAVSGCTCRDRKCSTRCKDLLEKIIGICRFREVAFYTFPLITS